MENAARHAMRGHTRPPTWVRVFVGAIGLMEAAAGFLLPRTAAAADKRVEIDKTAQELRAYEDGQLVLKSRISTGRVGKSTPNGRFSVGGKYRMHYSRRYDNAPMPYSVQVSGNIFIHGFTSVPSRPASHGCIRLPLSGGNPARQFFEWAEPGTPVSIFGNWSGKRAR